MFKFKINLPQVCLLVKHQSQQLCFFFDFSLLQTYLVSGNSDHAYYKKHLSKLTSRTQCSIKFVLKYSKKLKWRWNDAKTNPQKYVRFPFNLFQNLILQFQSITNQYKTTVSLSNKSIVVIGSPISCYWSFYIILHENIRKFLASDSFREYKHFQRVNGVGVKVEPKNLSILENLRFF